MEKSPCDISTNSATIKTQLMSEKSLKLSAFQCKGHVSTGYILL